MLSLDLPQEIVDYLKAPEGYRLVEKEIGTSETTDYICGPLYEELKKKFDDIISADVSSVDEVKEAPLAVQGKAPGSGLFSFDKYSSAPILIDAIRDHEIHHSSLIVSKMQFEPTHEFSKKSFID